MRDTSRKKHQQAFTLIELLVVMIIIGIASSIIAVKSSHYFISHKSGYKLAKDIAAHIELAKIQAIFSMSMLGVRLEGNRYTIVQLIENNNQIKWQPLGLTDPFWVSEVLPSNTIIQLKKSDMNKNEMKAIPHAPQILLYPSGEISSFTLLVQTLGDRESTEIEGNSAGQISILRKDSS